MIDKGKVNAAGLMEFMPQKEQFKFYQQYQDLIVDEYDKFIFLIP